MKIILNVLTHKKYNDLCNEINNLKRMIKLNYRTEINIIDGMDKLIQWAVVVNGDVNGKRIILIAPTEVNQLLDDLILDNSIKIFDINDRPDELASKVAETLVQDWDVKNSPKKESLGFTEIEAKTVVDLYMNKEKLTKTQQNVKYRVLRKLNLSNCYQLFIWWTLTDILPNNVLKKNIFIKKTPKNYSHEI